LSKTKPDVVINGSYKKTSVKPALHLSELSAAFVSFIIAHWSWCALASIRFNERYSNKRNKNLHSTPLV